MKTTMLKVEIINAENGYFFQVYDSSNSRIASFISGKDVYNTQSREVIDKILGIFDTGESTDEGRQT